MSREQKHWWAALAAIQLSHRRSVFQLSDELLDGSEDVSCEGLSNKNLGHHWYGSAFHHWIAHLKADQGPRSSNRYEKTFLLWMMTREKRKPANSTQIASLCELMPAYPPAIP